MARDPLRHRVADQGQRQERRQEIHEIARFARQGWGDDSDGLQAEQWDGELTICHVVESSAARPWRMERRVRNAEAEPDRLVRTSPPRRRISRHIVVGDPAGPTLEHARAIDVDFIVTGPAHGMIVDEKRLGSTAALGYSLH
ncbi:MAG: universal stress protein [Pseudomonadota bacterium]